MNLNRNELRLIMTANPEMAEYIVEGSDLRTTAALKAAYEAWQNAIDLAEIVKTEVLETAIEAKEVSQVVAVTIEHTSVSIGSLIVAALTSESAVNAYRTILKVIVMAVIFAAFCTVKIARWCWENRAKTAVYHWVQDGRSALRLDARVRLSRQWVNQALEAATGAWMRDRIGWGAIDF